MFCISCPCSIALVIYPKNPSRSEVLMILRNSLFFMMKGCNPKPNPKAGGPPLVVCPRLLIQYIHSSPLLLEAVPPSTTRGCAMLWWQGDPHNMGNYGIVWYNYICKTCSINDSKFYQNRA
jgi:hypothetical protein